MAMPDLRQKIGRPAMANAFNVIFGLGLGLVAPRETHLLFCPNLTMMAVAAASLPASGARAAATWTALCG